MYIHMYHLLHISAQKADTEYWENPQMFLSSGPHGPYYRLHSFKATDCLDTKNIRDLKIAGTLKYEVLYTRYGISYSWHRQYPFSEVS